MLTPVSAVLSARSARGLSLPAYVLETLAYAITLAYSYRNQFPFSTYGENLFLTIQNAIITILIVHYPSSATFQRQSTSGRVVLTSLLILASGTVLFNLPVSTLQLLQLLTLPLSVFSKLPQIQANHTARSTGQLSAFAVISQIAGCAARLFTTATEVGDRILLWGFGLALLLNAVLGAQMWMYWGRDLDARAREDSLGSVGVPVSVSEKERAWARQSTVDIVVPPKSPAPPQRIGSPAPGGRKWARKVD